MEKVQAGSITETFSFSRALHLMRYAGAKVRADSFDNGEYYTIDKLDGYETLVYHNDDTGEDFNMRSTGIDSEILFEGWMIYSEVIHGPK